MKLEPGQPAPEFSLYDSEKKKNSLSEFRGSNVVLLFFPQAFSRVCTKELCSIRDSLHEYDQLNAVVIGISVDSVYTLAKYKQVEGLNFTLLSDFNKEVSSLYGAIYETWQLEMKGVSKRAAFVIDSQGIIRYAEVLETAGDEPDYHRIRETLNMLR
jgi:peroxiredoxin